MSARRIIGAKSEGFTVHVEFVSARRTGARDGLICAGFRTGSSQSDCILSVFARHDTAREDIGELKHQIAAQFDDWHSALIQAFEANGAKPKRADREAHELMGRLYGALMQAKMHNKPELFTRTIKRLQKEYAA